MRTLFSVFARLILCTGAAALAALLCSVLTGTSDFLAQCIAYWAAPASMWGDLLQNFPFFGSIPFLEDILNSILSGQSALFSDDKQFAIFADLYFVVLSAIFMKLIEVLFDYGVRLLDRLCGTMYSVVDTIITGICQLFIVYLATGLAMVFRGIILGLFGSNYPAACLWMLAIFALLHLVHVCMTAPIPKPTRIFHRFLDAFGEGVLKLLYTALLYVVLLLWDIERSVGLSFGYVIVILICASVFLIMTINHAVDTVRKKS